MAIIHTRRQFLTTLAVTGAAGFIRAPRALGTEAELETTTVRISKDLAICEAPLYVAAQLLHAEGFTDVHYVDTAADANSAAITSHQVDFVLDFPMLFLPGIDAGKLITVLAGVHVGCIELFVRDGIHGVAELRGKSVGLEACPPAMLGLIAAQVGLDLDKDIRWITDPSAKPLNLFAEGKIDAFLAFPPEPQELRSRHAGNVILSTAVDHPWSQYFCCMLYGNREFVQNYPVATKRAMRAILKAADICAADPALAARQVVENGLTDRYDDARQTLTELPYDRWREYEPEDTIRFYALRLHEVGLIKSTPQKIIAENTDWRFLNELKRELMT
jgi:NitT/TauT family transport system substrate-binding protein